MTLPTTEQNRRGGSRFAPCVWVLASCSGMGFRVVGSWGCWFTGGLGCGKIAPYAYRFMCEPGRICDLEVATSPQLRL